MLERTLVLLKPSTIQRALIGEIINRFEKKGLRIAGMKMMQLDDAILEEHYSHLVKKPFFPSLKASMMKTPVIAMCLEGVDAIAVVRYITRFFKPEEIFDLGNLNMDRLYAVDEAN